MDTWCIMTMSHVDTIMRFSDKVMKYLRYCNNILHYWNDIFSVTLKPFMKLLVNARIKHLRTTCVIEKKTC